MIWFIIPIIVVVYIFEENDISIFFKILFSVCSFVIAFVIAVMMSAIFPFVETHSKTIEYTEKIELTQANVNIEFSDIEHAQIEHKTYMAPATWFGWLGYIHISTPSYRTTIIIPNGSLPPSKQNL